MYTVVYNSLTGNTKLLADTIKNVLPDNDNDDIVFVGFGLIRVMQILIRVMK